MGTNLVAALDVGGTSIKAAMLDERLRVVTALRAPTARAEPGAAARTVADQIAGLVRELEAGAGAPARATGVAVPGIVDDDAGIARFSANLGWWDAPMRDMLAERLGTPVAFAHDVRAGGLAEARLGAARGFDDVAFIAVGTGIACGLLIGGRSHHGGGYAGEIGHMDIGHGLPCTCGGTGCLEAIASAGAVARRYAERTGAKADGALGVVTAAQAGDADAVAVLTEATDGIGRAVLALGRIVAPQVVVLGGGLFAAGEFVLDPVRRWLSAHLVFQPAPELRIAELGDEAGCLGAGLLAIDAAASGSPASPGATSTETVDSTASTNAVAPQDVTS
ncbi:sugar kinase [Amycolatopsis antarctica]|uniref:Sugar kinase n=1 Tax=Amycolatopsis antarctica TaxID=1854586 RepID=A0A263CYE8_9PSEU|nr:ROK family protein [Amycolatopsis antarctica]OZM70948.1 sugar kinase [Amycolatopsis antarctica]